MLDESKLSVIMVKDPVLARVKLRGFMVQNKIPIPSDLNMWSAEACAEIHMQLRTQLSLTIKQQPTMARSLIIHQAKNGFIIHEDSAPVPGTSRIPDPGSMHVFNKFEDVVLHVAANFNVDLAAEGITVEQEGNDAGGK